MGGPNVSVNNWPQLVYQYTVGGIFFFLTLALCFRTGAGDLRSASDRTSLIYVLAGLGGYLAFHIAWIVLASS
jgi:hypothetical protein